MSININNLINSNPIQNTRNENVKNKEKNENIKENNNQGKEIVDKFEKSEVQTEATYKKPQFKPDRETIASIKAEVDQIHQNLRNLVEKLLKKQGMTFNNLLIGDPDIEIDYETKAEAQKAIDEGGELSIENVSDRLVNFAKAIAGGDKSKISLMRDSIKQGFEEAEKVFGGKLPDISYQTLDRAMEKLDAWENE